MQNETDANQEYIVLINAEEQYSLWPSFKAIPKGWSDVGVKGPHEECVAYVDRVWTDITPKSVRDSLAAHRAAQQQN